MESKEYWWVRIDDRITIAEIMRDSMGEQAYLTGCDIDYDLDEVELLQRIPAYVEGRPTVIAR